MGPFAAAAWRAWWAWALAPFALCMLGSHIFLRSASGAIGDPAMIPGRGAGLALAVGACAAALALWFRRTSAARGGPQPSPWLLGIHPAWWPLLGFAWLLGVWLFVSPRFHPTGSTLEPGLVWMVERIGAWAIAAGVAVWLAGRASARHALALSAFAGLALAIDALSTWVPDRRSFGDIIACGAWPPFGLHNFNVGGLVPLIVLGGVLALGWPRRASRPWLGWTMLAIGLLAALYIGLPKGLLAKALQAIGIAFSGSNDEWTRSTLVGLIAAACAAGVLMLPWRRLHLPLALAGVAAVLSLQGLVIAERIPVLKYGQSIAQRLFLWQSSLQSMQSPQCITGHGPASAIVALQDQPSFPAAWMSVPSYAEHSHHELLNTLVDGGIVLALIMAVALWATIAPLWRRRHRPLERALIVGWAACFGLMLVESHLSQPGPQLCLGLLAGLSWAAGAGPRPSHPVLPGRLLAPVALLACVLCSWQVARETTVAVAPPAVQITVERVAGRAREMRDWQAVRDCYLELRERLGWLADLRYFVAEAAYRCGDFETAEPLAVEQLRLLPGFAPTHDLVRRLRDRARKRGAEARAKELDAALAEALARARVLYAAIPEYQANAGARANLKRILE